MIQTKDSLKPDTKDGFALSTRDKYTNNSDTARNANLAQDKDQSQHSRDSSSPKKIEVTPFTLPPKNKKVENLNAGDYYYRALELQPSDYSTEVLRQEGVSFIERSEICTSYVFQGLSLQQLQELKFKDPEEFEKLRKNGYRRDENSQKKFSCTIL